MSVLCYGRNGNFWLKDVTIFDGTRESEVVVAFYSKLKAKTPPMYIEGPVDEVKKLLENVIKSLSDA